MPGTLQEREVCGSLAPKARGSPTGGGFLCCGTAAVWAAGREGLTLGFGPSWVGEEETEAPMGAAGGTERPPAIKPQL